MGDVFVELFVSEQRFDHVDPRIDVLWRCDDLQSMVRDPEFRIPVRLNEIFDSQFRFGESPLLLATTGMPRSIASIVRTDMLSINDGIRRTEVLASRSSTLREGGRRLMFGISARTSRSACVVAHVGTAANRLPGSWCARSMNTPIPFMAEGLKRVI